MALALFEVVDVLSILLEGLLEADFDPPQEDNKKRRMLVRVAYAL